MTLGQILRTFWKQILGFGAAFVVLTAFTVSDLNDLESEAVSSVSVWAPIAFVYEHFGYWPAVLLVPALGVVSGGGLCWRLMQTGRLQ